MTQPKSMTDSSLMPFGRYKGKKMIEVPGVYLMWLFNNACDHPGVKQYITDNLQALKNEAARALKFKRK